MIASHPFGKTFYAIFFTFYAIFFQKQPPRGVPRKRYSENMQQIYRRTPTSKCDFNKVGMLLFINKNNFIPFYNINHWELLNVLYIQKRIENTSKGQTWCNFENIFFRMRYFRICNLLIITPVYFWICVFLWSKLRFYIFCANCVENDDSNVNLWKMRVFDISLV